MHGVSATTNLGGHDRLYVFTSSTPFEPETSYSKFAAFAVLNHCWRLPRGRTARGRQRLRETHGHAQRRRPG